MNIYCRHCFVSGRVQGVGYRYATKQKAQALGITGWVKNLPDNRVEVMACGNSQQLEVFCDWLWQGPVAADVTGVCWEEVTCENFTEFQVVK